jgi:hypothetical protein
MQHGVPVIMTAMTLKEAVMDNNDKFAFLPELETASVDDPVNMHRLAVCVATLQAASLFLSHRGFLDENIHASAPAAGNFYVLHSRGVLPADVEGKRPVPKKLQEVMIANAKNADRLCTVYGKTLGSPAYLKGKALEQVRRRVGGTATLVFKEAPQAQVDVGQEETKGEDRQPQEPADSRLEVTYQAFGVRKGAPETLPPLVETFAPYYRMEDTVVEHLQKLDGKGLLSDDDARSVIHDALHECMKTALESSSIRGIDDFVVVDYSNKAADDDESRELRQLAQSIMKDDSIPDNQACASDHFTAFGLLKLMEVSRYG